MRDGRRARRPGSRRIDVQHGGRGLILVALLGSILAGCGGGGVRPEPTGRPPAGAPSDTQAAPAGAPAAAATVRPPQPEAAKVTVADASLAGNDAALWTAVERGYFQEYGLDVDLLYTRTVSGIQ